MTPNATGAWLDGCRLLQPLIGMRLHAAMLMALVVSCVSRPPAPAVLPTVSPEKPVPTGPEIAVVKPTIMMSQKIEPWAATGAGGSVHTRYEIR